MNMAPNGIIAVDADERIVFINAPAEELFRYGPHELLGQRFEMLVPDAAGAVASGRPAAPPVPAAVSELPGRRRDGSTFRARISLSPIEVDGRRLTAVAVDDSAAPIENRASGPDGVVHDLDTLLAVVLRRATFVRKQLTVPVDHPTGDRMDHVRGDVDEILLATGRASVLSHQLLALARATTQPLTATP